MVQSIFVLSGKGGTGKTLVAINIAYRLKERGYNVGLIDADLDSPNVAEFLELEEEISIVEHAGKRYFKPIVKDGIQIFTMASICGKGPVSMRGIEYGKILKDVVNQSLWDVHFFIVDLPAGASDELRTAANILADGLLGSIIVTQPTHTLDAERMIQLHKQEGIPVLGIIENMRTFKCECGKEYDIFGPSTIEELSKKYDVAAFGSIPLSMKIREAYEAKKPYIKEDPIFFAIDIATEKILESKPISKDFLQRIREGGKAIARNILIDVVGRTISIINRDIDIEAYQKTYGFRGGRVVLFNVCDRTLENVKASWYFTIRDGLLLALRNPRKVDVEIRIWDKALIWATIGNRMGTPYDWINAWLLGHAEFYGTGGETQDALYWIKEVWSDLGVAIREKHPRLYGLLKRLA